MAGPEGLCVRFFVTYVAPVRFRIACWLIAHRMPTFANWFCAYAGTEERLRVIFSKDHPGLEAIGKAMAKSMPNFQDYKAIARKMQEAE